MPWSGARFKYSKASIIFATSGVVIKSGLIAYVSDESSTESIAERSKDGQAAGRLGDQMLFSAAVDNFQAYLSDLLTEIVNVQPKIVSSKQFKAQMLFEAPDLETLKERFIEKFIMDLGYQNVVDLSEYFDKTLGIKTLNHWLTKVRINRIFQIRNSIAHNRGVVNHIYLFRSKSKSDVLNDPVKLISPLKVHSYLGNLASSIDLEAVGKFCLTSPKF